eukprot:CAMPEP_0119269810 /NCGR_PEP_ID=MMETSP1329-20130426/7064_1 /TAXON_ID=114041 /ORGANISM="Genus nov. species nov., Strain RCC1024" /LENGTH=143 /DNA_ID=CAMNT_0007269811 /DNA_START=43 /DNA_END=471 /DNA_ORIENTATION=+
MDKIRQRPAGQAGALTRARDGLERRDDGLRLLGFHAVEHLVEVLVREHDAAGADEDEMDDVMGHVFSGLPHVTHEAAQLSGMSTSSTASTGSSAVSDDIPLAKCWRDCSLELSWAARGPSDSARFAACSISRARARPPAVIRT